MKYLFYCFNKKIYRIKHTFLIRHEVFCLVFAVVETAGQNHIIIVTLIKKKEKKQFLKKSEILM